MVVRSLNEKFSPVGVTVVIRITELTVEAYLAPGLVTISTLFICDDASWSSSDLSRSWRPFM